MELFLMRHGPAESPYSWKGSDVDRPLSMVGLAEVHQAAQYMGNLGLEISTILSSPFVRAWETARIIQSVLSDCVLVKEKSLAAGAKIDTIKKMLLSTAAKGPLLLVGHNPDLSVLACRITGIARFLDDLSLNPGEMMKVETGPFEEQWDKGALLWRRNLSDWSQIKSL